MDLDIGRICKIIATTIAVITVIVATVGALIVAVVAESFLTFIIAFIICGLSGFLLFVLWYALGEVIEILEGIRGAIGKTNRLLENGNVTSVGASVATNGIARSAAQPKPESWICKKCNAKNPSNVISCVDCGTYK